MLQCKLLKDIQDRDNASSHDAIVIKRFVMATMMYWVIILKTDEVDRLLNRMALRKDCDDS